MATGSYKLELRTTTVSAAIGDAYLELGALRDELDEIIDNAPDGLRSTARIQTMEETKDQLDRYADDEPSVPDACKDFVVTYHEQVPRRKRQSASRSVRCENSCAMIRAVVQVVEEWRDEDPARSEEVKDEIDTFIESANEAADECENLEFPAMFG